MDQADRWESEAAQGPREARSARDAMPTGEEWTRAMGELGERRRAGPARCWLLQEGAGRAEDIARRVASGAPGRRAAIVALEFTDEGGSSSVDGEYFRPRGARQLYDELARRASALDPAHLRILAIDRAQLADLPSANVLRALMLEEPRQFDAVVASGDASGPAVGLWAPLGRPVGP